MSNSLTVGAIVRCRIWVQTAAGGGQASVNTLHYTVASIGGVAATDSDVAVTLDSVVHVDYKALLSSTAVYRGVQAQILNSIPPFLAFFAEQFTIANFGVGSVAGPILPPQTSGLISFSTARAGVAFRGRSYVSFPGQADDSGGGSPSASYTARLANLASDFGGGLAIAIAGRSATLVRVLLHRKNKAGITPPPDPVISFVGSRLWATQRRRGYFGRLNRSPI